MIKIDMIYNGVNGIRATSEGATPGRVSGEQQPAPARYPATARTKWSKELNRLVMKCYIRSNPGSRGYRKRMLAFWREVGEFEIGEQRLAGQARAVKVNGWLSDVEMEELKREVNNEGGASQDTSRPTHMSGEMMTDNESQSVYESAMQSEQERGASQYRNGPSHLTSEPMTGSEPQFESDMQNEAGRACSHHSTSWEIEQLRDEEKDIYDMILKVVNKGVRERMPALQKVNKKKLNAEVKRVNQVLEKMDTEEITNTNDLIYAGAVVVTEELGLRDRKGSHPKEPMWKRRLEGLRRDLSRVVALLQERSVKE